MPRTAARHTLASAETSRPEDARATRTTSLIPTATWTVDAAHSSVEFGIKHMGIATVRGKFTEFEGTLAVGEDLASSSASGTVTAASITTDEEQRDAHLRSPDFFNVEEHPEITFESTQIQAIDDESTHIAGNLTRPTQRRQLRARPANAAGGQVYTHRADNNRIRSATSRPATASTEGARATARSAAAPGWGGRARSVDLLD